MFENGFPKHWSTLKKLIWLVGSGIAGGASAVEKTVSGAIVHILDALAKPAISLKCEINPVQDLHGYDTPWPAGGGKQIFPLELQTLKMLNTGGTWNNNAYTVSGVTITVQDDGSLILNGTATGTVYFNFITNANVKTINAGTYTLHKTGISGVSVAVAKNGSYWASAISNDQVITADSTATLTAYMSISNGIALSNAHVYPMLESGSTASPFAPYSNECPISGWTGLSLEHTGANLFGGTVLRDGVKASMPSAVDYPDDGYISFTAAASTTQSITEGLPFKENTQYTFVLAIYGQYSNLRLYYTDGTYTAIPNPTSSTQKETFVIVTTAGKTVERLAKRNSNGTTRLYYNESGLFEGVHTASDFVPYQGETIPVSWQTEAGTVYGGTLNVTTGVLTVKQVSIDLGTLIGWQKGSFTVGVIFRNTINNKARYSKLMCSKYTYSDNGGFATPHYFIGDSKSENYATTIFLNDPNLDNLTTTQIIDAVSGVQLVYELATPITIQLDPVTVNLLLGENNIWHDANGNIELTYYADGNASTSEALGILLGGAYHNPGGADDVSDEEALGILLGGN